MIGRYYKPDEKFCLIFDNVNYEKLRELPEFAQRHKDDNELMYPDMPRAREWANEFEEGIKNYGFSAEQIERYSDSDGDTIFRAIFRAHMKI